MLHGVASYRECMPTRSVAVTTKDTTTDRLLRRNDVDEFRGSSPSKVLRRDAFDKEWICDR